MPAYFDTGFMVRTPAWHGLGVVLDEYPGREEAMRLAGHDFTVVEKKVALGNDDPTIPPQYIPGWKALVKQSPDEIADEDPENGKVLHIAKASYGVIQNETAWDIVDAIVGEGAKYETGLTLKGGSVCSVLAWLPEPVMIPGDNSEILPWVNVAWTHDGSGACTARSTSIRTVCWNTQSAAEAQGKRLGTDFTFRHTKNVKDRIEDARMALQGVRDAHEEYVMLATELAELPVNDNQRELFVTTFLPMPPEALISSRVMSNVEDARTALRGLFDGPTIPDAHRNTGYGLHLAGVEYLDHLRGYKSKESYFGRAMLRPEPAKAKLTRLIRDVAVA